MKQIFYILIKISIALFVTIISIFLYFIYPWVAIYLGVLSEPNPPEPEIRYAEFAVAIEFEYDDRIEKIEDTLIIEYDGIEMNEGTGKVRIWKSHFASGREELFTHIIDNKSRIDFLFIDNEYLMNDPLADYDSLEPRFVYAVEKGSFTDRFILENKELLETYGIKILKIELPKPIKNNFK